MAERKMRSFGHITQKDGIEKRPMLGRSEGKRRRVRPATACCQDRRDRQDRQDGAELDGCDVLDRQRLGVRTDRKGLSMMDVTC